LRTLRSLAVLGLLLPLLLAGCSSSGSATSAQQQPSSSAPPAPTPPPEVVTPERPLPEAPAPARGFDEAVEAGTRTREGRPGPNYWTNTARYDLTARLFPDARRLEGTGTIVYTNRSPNAIRRFFLELAQNLHKEGVVRNEPVEVTGGVELTYVVVEGDTLRATPPNVGYGTRNTNMQVALPGPLASGDSVTIDVGWRFTLPQAGASGRMGYTPADDPDLLYLAYWYPQVSVYDDVQGWMLDPFLGRAEFYADHADYDLAIEAPAGWMVQATGLLQNAGDVLTPEAKARYDEATTSDTPMMIAEPDEDVTAAGTDGRLTWRYRAERVRDVAFNVSKNAHWEAARTPVGDRDGDGATDYTQIHTFWRPSAPLWSEVTRYQQHAITFLSAHTAFPYPWPHMTAVEGAGIIGGGMEFPMMTIMGDYTDRGARALYAVTAHELAHMWVPMIVSTNERRYSWIDEGTTSFNENDARVDFYDGDSPALEEGRGQYLRTARADLEGPIMRWSNYHYNGTAFGVASYPKPADLLVTLRGLLGEETFYDAYHTFIDDWAYGHPYPQDFFNAFERASGQDLDWFWHSFYYETWTLDHAITGVTQSGNMVEVEVADLGKAFMPVRLTLTLADGTTVQHEVPVDVWLSGRTQATTRVTVDGPVDRVEIDAEEAFPDLDRDNNVWTRTDATDGSSR
jgi:hypothetical protein